MITETPFARLFLGGRRDAARLSIDNPLKITMLINLSLEDFRQRPEEIRHQRFPLPDHEVVPPPVLEGALAAIAHHIRGGRVLLCCDAGLSRSVAVAALYLHVVGYTSYEDALRAIGLFREVDVSPAMKKSVESYLELLAKEEQK